MTKRRVRHHVNPLADTTEHFFTGFENDRPIIMDIGADRGEFTQQLIEKFGETKNYIVCEIRKPLAIRLRDKFAVYDNVEVFDGDIVRNFENIVRSSVEQGVLLEEVYVNFPDPWFKERHKKRRVITREFIEKIKKWISPETRWIFQTDQRVLFDETIDMLMCLDGVNITLLNQPPHGATTKWEKAKVQQGANINRLSFTIG